MRQVSEVEPLITARQLEDFALQLLQADHASQAKQLIDPLLNTLCTLTGIELHPEFFQDTEATITEYGKAVSPTTAAQCAEDPERSRVFIQGIYQAIRDQQRDKLMKDEAGPVQLLYAGTGPFAWLLLPLLPLFSAQELRVTLLDIHPASLNRVQLLLDTFQVRDRVDALICADATRWQPGSEKTFDLIVSETMKHLLQQEPQVQIFVHLQQFLRPQGQLIPQEIKLEAWLEYYARQSAKQQAVQNNYLGTFFNLDKHSAKQLADGNNALLSGTLPVPIDLQAVVVDVKFTTSIKVYRAHELHINQSQLTLPQYKKGLRLRPGSLMTFTYQQEKYPDFHFEFVEDDIELAPSTDVSSLGIFHLRRLWQKYQLKKSGIALSIPDEWLLDTALLDLLGVGLEPGIAALFTYQEQPDFENFILQNKHLTSENIDEINRTLY